MDGFHQSHSENRYHAVAPEKAGGATYTPKILADFVAQKMIQLAGQLPTGRPIRILDPAVGRGELIVSLLNSLSSLSSLTFDVHGFETDHEALEEATVRIERRFPSISLNFKLENFVDFVLNNFGNESHENLFCFNAVDTYDLIIANPPYVRTQIMGAPKAQVIAKQFGLSGRVDLYHAFILGISCVLQPKGIAGLIVSNRFMTTKSGAPVREALLRRFSVRHVWDLGDTKLFDAAVLPAVLLVEEKNGRNPNPPIFTSIYQTKESVCQRVANPVRALAKEGIVETDDGRRFRVQHGKLDTSGAADGVWRITTDAVDTWLKTVERHSWACFRDIGKIRVGVKTCADKIFIRDDWDDMPEDVRPELLRTLTTHHVARRFKPLSGGGGARILYPHEVVHGRRRPVDLERFPRSKTYLNAHRRDLENRKYVIKAGRKWYEIWVPQDPCAWFYPKLVFRDIADEPVFWIDLDQSVVNGDCYWLVCQDPAQTDLLWLAAAIGNSTFIEQFYDYLFHNKLYAGRRRFITQYVENFPIPNPQTSLGKAIIAKAKIIYESISSSETTQLQHELDNMVWKSFGLGCIHTNKLDDGIIDGS